MSAEVSKPFNVVPASIADAEAIAEMNASMAAETEDKQLDRPLLLAGVRALLADHHKGFYLLAWRGDDLVGQLMVTFEWSDWRNGTFYWIQSVYVRPSARRTGVYRALYDAVLARAKTQPGVCGVRLYVESENNTAMRTYEALGMKRAHYEMYEVDFVLA